MPAFKIPIGGVVKNVVYCSIAGQVATNSRQFQLVSLATGQDAWSSAMTTQYDNAMAELYKPLLSSDAVYYGVQSYLQNPIGAPLRPDTTRANEGPGTSGPGLLPGQSSGLISYYTDYLGPQGQGRTYIPFPAPISNDVDGTPTGIYLDGLAGIGVWHSQSWNIILDGVVALFEPVLYQGGVDTPRIIETHVERAGWATQRRRGAFGSANGLPF